MALTSGPPRFSSLVASYHREYVALPRCVHPAHALVNRSRKFRVPGHSEPFKWKRVAGAWQVSFCSFLPLFVPSMVAFVTDAFGNAVFILWVTCRVGRNNFDFI